MMADSLARLLGQAEAGGGAATATARPNHDIERLFRAEAPRLFRFFSRRIRQEDAAADLLQETFLRFLRIGEQRARLSTPEAYLQRIASNLLHDLARQGALRPATTPTLQDPEGIADPSPTPLQHLEAQDMLLQYQRALAGLKPKTREIFLLHRRDGLTYGEIAIQTNLTVSGVEKQMMKAIAHIDRVIERP